MYQVDCYCRHLRGDSLSDLDKVLFKQCSKRKNKWKVALEEEGGYESVRIMEKGESIIIELISVIFFVVAFRWEA